MDCSRKTSPWKGIVPPVEGEGGKWGKGIIGGRFGLQFSNGNVAKWIGI